jgi:hypothetical protein
MRFEIFTALNMWNVFLWPVTPRSLVGDCRRFGGTFRPQRPHSIYYHGTYQVEIFDRFGRYSMNKEHCR